MSFLLEPCPAGYHRKIGDLPGWGSDLGSALELTEGQCAHRCDERHGCLSFEHSQIQMTCNLNRIAEPTSEAYEDFKFCIKGEDLGLDSSVFIIKLVDLQLRKS